MLMGPQVKAVPIRKDDEVAVVRGTFKVRLQHGSGGLLWLWPAVDCCLDGKYAPGFKGDQQQRWRWQCLLYVFGSGGMLGAVRRCGVATKQWHWLRHHLDEGHGSQPVEPLRQRM